MQIASEQNPKIIIILNVKQLNVIDTMIVLYTIQFL